MERKNNHEGKRKRRSRLLKIVLIVASLLLIIRLALPYVTLHFANKTLASMHGYYGHVEDIDIALIRGAYQLNNLYLNKIDSVTERQTPFFRVETIDLSLEWRAIFHGAITGEMEFIRPILRFTKDKAEPKDVKKDTTDFRILLKKFMPLKINRFEVNGGVLAYHDSSTKPPVSIEMTNVHILAENLKNVYPANDILPATVDANAYLYRGKLNFSMRLNPLAQYPTFDLNAELTNTFLPDMNEFLKAYGKFDVNKGNFGLFSEMAAKDNKFTGYVKPVIRDLDVLGPENRHDSFLQKMWEGFVGTVGVIFRNQRKDQIATKIPIEGNFKDPDTGVVDAIVEVIVNAFIQALVPAIDNEISLKSVDIQPMEKKGVLHRLLHPKESLKKNSGGDKKSK